MLFRRRLSGDLTQEVGNIKTINELNFSGGSDKIEWLSGSKGKYTLKSMYSYLERNLGGRDYMWIWKAKLPAKI